MRRIRCSGFGHRGRAHVVRFSIMRTLTIDENYRDLVLNAPLATGTDSLRMRVMARLRFWSETWFLDLNDGVPYLASIINRQNVDHVPRAILTQQVLGVDGVAAVRDVTYRYDRSTRKATYTCTVVEEGTGATAEVGTTLTA